MDKRVEPLAVATTKDGGLEILQDYGSGNDGDPAVIRVPVHQIDLLIQWLSEAKKELLVDVGGAK